MTGRLAMDFDGIKGDLKNIVDGEGIDFLSRNPMDVYKKLISSADADLKLCRCVLIVLLAGITDQVRDYQPDGDNNVALFLKWIQSECCFKKSTADGLAKMFLSLFSPENMTAWSSQEESGFREFCEAEWEYSFEGEETWHSGGGHVDCSCIVGIDFSVSDPDKARKMVARALALNPFLTDEAIYELFAKKLDELLDRELYEYATGDDYYQPYMEDFGVNCQPAVEKFCKESGLDLLNLTCTGEEVDFEPDGRW